MVAYAPEHDSGAKTLLNGSVSPAGITPLQDLNNALDNIFNHPNVGPFVGKQLIQHLVKSNPSAAYVSRVASAFNNNGQSVRGRYEGRDYRGADGPGSSRQRCGRKRSDLGRPFAGARTLCGCDGPRLRRPDERSKLLFVGFGQSRGGPLRFAQRVQLLFSGVPGSEYALCWVRSSRFRRPTMRFSAPIWCRSCSASIPTRCRITVRAPSWI